jgi:peptidyl-Lys metalloendopeptidase
VNRGDRLLRRRAALVAIAAGGVWVTAPAQGAAAALHCELSAPQRGRAGAAFMLRFALVNDAAAAVRVLDWNTPFEPGWFNAYLEVSREGQPLVYRGASMKRGDPAADNYLLIAAHRARRASVDLALAFDLSQPGRYRVEPRLMLHDVAPAGTRVPRARDAHRHMPLACPAIEFVLT